MHHNVMTQMGRGVIQVKRAQRPRNARVPRGNGNSNGVQSQKAVADHLKSEQFPSLGFSRKSNERSSRRSLFILLEAMGWSSGPITLTCPGTHPTGNPKS